MDKKEEIERLLAELDVLTNELRGVLKGLLADADGAATCAFVDGAGMGDRVQVAVISPDGKVRERTDTAGLGNIVGEGG